MSDKQPLVTGQPPAYQASAPPPQYQPPAPTTVYVTQPAPTTTTTVVYQRRYGAGDSYLLFSIVVSIVCFFWCGGWPSLLCTVPAIFFAINAQEAEARGDHATMANNARVALILDICGIAFGVLSFIIIVLSFSIHYAVVVHYYNSN